MNKKQIQKEHNKLIDDIAVLLQKLVRIKAAGADGYATCCSCGIRKHWKELQGGHWISRTHQGTKIVEENINPQCPGCNFRSGKGDTYVTLQYQKFMREMHGEGFCEELMLLAKQPLETSTADLRELYKETKERLKEAEKKVETFDGTFGADV